MIYLSDTFSGSGSANGHAPDEDFNDAVWRIIDPGEPANLSGGRLVSVDQSIMGLGGIQYLGDGPLELAVSFVFRTGASISPGGNEPFPISLEFSLGGLNVFASIFYSAGWKLQAGNGTPVAFTGLAINTNYTCALTIRDGDQVLTIGALTATDSQTYTTTDELSEVRAYVGWTFGIDTLTIERAPEEATIPGLAFRVYMGAELPLWLPPLVSQEAQNLIFKETFGAANGPLHGKTPNVTINGATWSAAEAIEIVGNAGRAHPSIPAEGTGTANIQPDTALPLTLFESNFRIKTGPSLATPAGLPTIFGLSFVFGGDQISFTVFYNDSPAGWTIQFGASTALFSAIATDTEYEGSITSASGTQTLDINGQTLGGTQTYSGGLSSIVLTVGEGGHEFQAITAAVPEGEASIDVTLPMVTAAIVAGGAIVEIALPVPSISFLAGGAILEAQLPIVTFTGFIATPIMSTNLPVPTLLIVTGDSVIDATLPALTFTGSIVSNGETNFMVVLPMVEFLVETSPAFDVTLPMVQFAATGEFQNGLMIDAVLPMVVFEASGIFGESSDFAVILPMVLFSAETGAAMIFDLPMVQFSASVENDNAGLVDITLPALTFFAQVETINSLALEIDLPMLVPTGYAVVDVTLPMVMFKAEVLAVIAVAYAAYAANLKSGEDAVQVTRYTNFPFNQIRRWQGNYYGVADGAVYLLGGATDFAEPKPLVIPWGFETHVTDFGTPLQKTPVSAYVGGRLGRTETFTLHAGEKKEHSYRYSNPRGDTAQNYRQKFGRGIKARYFAVELAGDGANEIDNIEFDILNMTRRI